MPGSWPAGGAGELMAEKSLSGSVKQASKSNSSPAWWSMCLTLVGVPQNTSCKTEAQSQWPLGHRTCCWRALSRAAQLLGTQDSPGSQETPGDLTFADVKL